jgi:uncharacterized RDD family membrane protein YckC
MSTDALDGEIINNRLDDRRLYDGVLTRRVFAFVVDYIIIAVLCFPVAIVVLLLGLLTLGLGWALFGVMGPAVALIYIWCTLGSSSQSTVGMRAMGIRLERLDGGRVDGTLAVLHSILFWVSVVPLTPLTLLVTLFTDRKRTLHDLVLGTVVARTDR